MNDRDEKLIVEAVKARLLDKKPELVLEEMLWKRIMKLELSENDDYLRFTTDAGTEFVYYTDGDCCSRSYITDLNGVQSLLGHFITGVERVDVPDPTPNPRDHDCIQAYGFKVTTVVGYFDIVFHNSSNGYYGGSLMYIPEAGDAVAAFREITEDFSS